MQHACRTAPFIEVRTYPLHWSSDYMSWGRCYDRRFFSPAHFPLEDSHPTTVGGAAENV